MSSRGLVCNPVLYPICQLYHLIKLKTYFASQSNTYCLWRALHGIFVFFATHFIPTGNNLFILNKKLPIIVLKHLNATHGNVILRLRLYIDSRRLWMFLGLGGANRCGCNSKSITSARQHVSRSARARDSQTSDSSSMLGKSLRAKKHT